MTPEELSLITTKDGSHSLFSSRFQDTYHSQHGAIQESVHVFIKQGLAFIADQGKSINLLELGFGTGLNFMLSYLFLREHPQITLHYESWEAYPPSAELVRQLNYTAMLNCAELDKVYDLDWDHKHSITPNLYLTKKLRRFEEIEYVDTFDLIYHDAFAPTKQPIFWQKDFLEKIALAAKPNAVLVTYCAQGAFRRALLEVGFTVERLPGPPGKREMLRAIKK